jgi:hypothetical protein
LLGIGGLAKKIPVTPFQKPHGSLPKETVPKCSKISFETFQ